MGNIKKFLLSCGDIIYPKFTELHYVLLFAVIAMTLAWRPGYAHTFWQFHVDMYHNAQATHEGWKVIVGMLLFEVTPLWLAVRMIIRRTHDAPNADIAVLFYYILLSLLGVANIAILSRGFHSENLWHSVLYVSGVVFAVLSGLRVLIMILGDDVQKFQKYLSSRLATNQFSPGQFALAFGIAFGVMGLLTQMGYGFITLVFMTIWYTWLCLVLGSRLFAYLKTKKSSQ